MSWSESPLLNIKSIDNDVLFGRGLNYQILLKNNEEG